MTQHGGNGSGSGSNSSDSGFRKEFKERGERSVFEKLMVAVRIRPLNADEIGRRTLHAVNKKIIMLHDLETDKSKRSLPRQYFYDLVLGEDSSQESVYEGTSKPLVQDIINGYNATVFAYGATGAGKTHTMVGSAEEPGVMVRALNDIFLAARQLSDSVNVEVTMSYLEIYNENIRDLLSPSAGYLELRDESRGRNVQVIGLTEVSTNSTEEVMKLLHQGNKARSVEPTAANETSSRSHALLSVLVKQTTRSSAREICRRAKIKQGKLFMIDLAGSERAKQTKNHGKRLQEGAHINRSLLALGNCITALADGARYVNYRDSKLTRLLKDALGGNCRTVMIAHVSPAAIHREETKNTLMYADRANRVTNKVEQNVNDVNYHVSQYRDMIGDLKNEITRLRNKMGNSERARTTDQDLLTTRSGDLRILREKIVSAFKEQMRLRRKLMELDSHLLGLNIAAEQQHAIISHWESKNNKLYKSTNDSIRRCLSADSQVDEIETEAEEQEMDDITVQQAWTELSEISKEQERYSEMRAITERELETCRQRSASLEDELPSRINSDEERELLALMLRVHELEADKMMLQSERLVKQHELRRRELLLLRYDRQRQISDEIITRQRRIMEDGNMILPNDLQELYIMYQREIHAAAYNDRNLVDLSVSSMLFNNRLPPITRGENFDSSDDTRIASSSTDSDWEFPLPTITEPREFENVMGPIVHPLVSPSVFFPPISNSTNKIQNNKLRRIASDNYMNLTDNSRNGRLLKG